MKTVDFKHFQLEAGDRVLDLGCGEGRHVISAYVEGEVDVVGVDLCLKDLQTAQQRASDFIDNDDTRRSFGLANADALNLPFADNSFDKVICSEVLEHIPDYRAVLVEIERILKPGGLFCASVPRAWPEQICWALSREYHEVEGGHLRIFKAAKLRKQIQGLGFKFYRRHWAHALHSPYWWLKCLFWEKQDDNPLVKAYHRFLVWDLLDRPLLTRGMEAALNPVMGKSVVMYFRKGEQL
ncbi:class I SAM-dependent methyltransferase [Spongiibacter sp. KMU-158]|uniref:Class I SAM-dependent methyltransferase n=1 Tax=Spongiibacter pelagi TaxID=2760804 RepID=A0A927BXK4_9GAMM|nr:class I SAM-dependent methyltransferase [Spongiibacter pelagi]MBD2857413.1 class I SAM-dependent methyltransferase [Spongiibacter pelagi]